MKNWFSRFLLLAFVAAVAGVPAQAAWGAYTFDAFSGLIVATATTTADYYDFYEGSISFSGISVTAEIDRNGYMVAHDGNYGYSTFETVTLYVNMDNGPATYLFQSSHSIAYDDGGDCPYPPYCEQSPYWQTFAVYTASYYDPGPTAPPDPTEFQAEGAPDLDDLVSWGVLDGWSSGDVDGNSMVLSFQGGPAETAAATCAVAPAACTAVAVGTGVLITVAWNNFRDFIRNLHITYSTTVNSPYGWPGSDPSHSPGEGWVWKPDGTEPGSGPGAWTKPSTGESLSPDLDHPGPIGPHWDYKDPNHSGPGNSPAGKGWRVWPNGTMTPKP